MVLCPLTQTAGVFSNKTHFLESVDRSSILNQFVSLHWVELRTLVFLVIIDRYLKILVILLIAFLIS